MGIKLGIFNFFKRGEDELLSKVINYSLLVSKTVIKLRELITLLVEKGTEDPLASSTFGEIDMLETQADEFHKKLTEELAAGSFFSYLGEDFLALLENIDGIADSAKDASKILVESRLKHNSIKFLFYEIKGMEYIDSLYDTVEALIKCLKSLKKTSPMDMLHLIREVEAYEESADRIKEKLMKGLYLKADQLPILDVISLKDFLNTVDDVADKAEDSSDILLQIISKGYV